MLETNRCKLLELQQSDYDDVKKLYTNEKVREFLGGPRNEEQYKISFSDMCKPQHGSLYWIIRQKNTNEFIGLISLDLHHDGAATEVSYQLLPQWWGQGYATEIIGLVINFAFKELKLQKLVAETQSANIRSRKLLEKVGMNLEKTVQRFGAEQSIYIILNKSNECLL